MIAPRLQIDLTKIRHNARVLIRKLKRRGIATTGVTKAFLGLPELAKAFVDAGVCALGDARIENIEAMRRGHVAAKMMLIRSPMLSQVERVVASADLSFNTEPEVISALSLAARASGRMHDVLLMVELGDLREGIMPSELASVVRHTLQLSNVSLKGIGANLACRSGVRPDAKNMAHLSDLANAIEAQFCIAIGTVTGGNSSNLDWAFSASQVGRINDLRLGESILLGKDPSYCRPISGLHTDAITLVAEVIEAKMKPSIPWGELGQSAFGHVGSRVDRGNICQAILAVGRQDLDASDLQPPAGVRILGVSSDHLVVRSTFGTLAVGDELEFQLNYSALLRAMTSPFVAKQLISKAGGQRLQSARSETAFMDVEPRV